MSTLNYKNSRLVFAVFGGLFCFVLVMLASKGLARLFPSEIVWFEQVLLKVLLILVSLFLIRFVLKLSWQDAGFQKPVVRMNRLHVYGGGAALGACTTLLIFFTPAAGNPLIKSLNLLEFLLIIGVWSSLAEEIFIRGLIQSYLQPFAQEGVSIGKIFFSLPVIICAATFGGMHLSLLFSDIDPFTVAITVIAHFLLGVFAGVLRERYNSIIPAFLTHVSFNIGAMGMAIGMAIVYKIITGDFPPH